MMAYRKLGTENMESPNLAVFVEECQSIKHRIHRQLSREIEDGTKMFSHFLQNTELRERPEVREIQEFVLVATAIQKHIIQLFLCEWVAQS